MTGEQPVTGGYDSSEVKKSSEKERELIERRVISAIEAHDKKLDALYKDKLDEEGRLNRESVVISLAEIPQDDKEERLRSLERKLEEYTQRYKNYLMAFDMDGAVQTMYSRDILRILLRQGEINTWAYSNAIAEQYNMVITREYFNNAASVVHDYIRTGGSNVRGGGLPTAKN